MVDQRIDVIRPAHQQDQRSVFLFCILDQLRAQGLKIRFEVILRIQRLA